MIAEIVSKKTDFIYLCKENKKTIEQYFLKSPNYNNTFELYPGDRVAVIRSEKDYFILGVLDNGRRIAELKTESHVYKYIIDKDGISEGIKNGSPNLAIKENTINVLAYDTSIVPGKKDFTLAKIEQNNLFLKQTNHIELQIYDKLTPNIPSSIKDFFSATDYRDKIRYQLKKNSIELSPDNTLISSKNLNIISDKTDEKVDNEKNQDINYYKQIINKLESKITSMEQEISTLKQTVNNLSADIGTADINVDNLKLSGSTIELDYDNVLIKQNNVKFTYSDMALQSNSIRLDVNELNINNDIKINHSMVVNSLILRQNNDIIINGNGMLNSMPIAKKMDSITVNAGQLVTTPQGPGTTTTPGTGVIV